MFLGLVLSLPIESVLKILDLAIETVVMTNLNFLPK